MNWYFDILYIRIYKQYLKWSENDIPKLTSLLVLSLFQSLNVISFYILIRSLLGGNTWTLSKLHVILIMIAVACADYLWIFRFRDFDKLLEKYEISGKDTLVIHPLIYFGLSIGTLFILKLAGLFPNFR